MFQPKGIPLYQTYPGAICNEIKLVEYINHAVTWDPKQWKVSPGQHILALVINTLCGRVPLYRVEKNFMKTKTWRDFSGWEELRRTLIILHLDGHSTRLMRPDRALSSRD